MLPTKVNGAQARFSRDVLRVDAAAVSARIEADVRETVLATLRRRGVVVGISGGVDSAVTAALCARALGPDRVLALLMPERASSAAALRLGRLLAGALGVRCEVEDLTAALEGFGCYARQAEAVRQAFPAYGDGWRMKLVLPSLLESDRLNLTSLVVEDPDGRRHSARLPAAAYLQLVAATNFKQRSRAAMAYYHADRLAYAVGGTPNRLEYDQGFFVKHGDGAADLTPIAHLYKTQVYALAAHLGVPEEILRRPPTTDTFTLDQSQEEFYFALPWPQMDLCLWACDHGVPPAEVAEVLGLTPEQVARVFRDVAAKRRVAAYLHHVPRPLPEEA